MNTALEEMAATDVERPLDPETRAAYDRFLASFYVTTQCERCGLWKATASCRSATACQCAAAA